MSTSEFPTGGAHGQARTKEPQYDQCVEIRDSQGFSRLGLMSNQVWVEDPKRLVFVLSRYKFVAKMLAGRGRVLEVGCSDGFASKVVRQEVKELVATDFDPLFIEDARANNSAERGIDFRTHDILSAPLQEQFDAAYALDVFEHIDPAQEERFVVNIADSLSPTGTLILGIPSLESQAYASPQSREGHVNCKSGSDFRKVLERHFHNVFLFSMNDEVVHTGFSPMAHYLLAICCQRKSS